MKNMLMVKKSSVYINYFLLIVVSLIMIFPIIWIASCSFKSMAEFGVYPPKLIPEDLSLKNYFEVFRRVKVLVYLKNTLILMIVPTLGTLISCPIVAYPLARMNFRGKNIVFGIILATMMVPGVTILIPQYVLFVKLGWVNTFLPFIVPAFFACPYNVFLFRQYFKTIPMSIDESALIDGCTRWQILVNILVPLSKPIFITIGTLSSINWWNEILGPLIYLDKDSLRPLTIASLTAFRTEFFSRMDLQMAMSIMMIFPPILIYLFSQKYIVEGIKTTGFKG